MNRGNETPQHRTMKKLLKRHFESLGYTCAFELREADVAGFKVVNGRHHTMAGEAERSCRNVIRNITRDVSRGADLVVIGCWTEKMAGAVRRTISRHLPEDLHSKVQVMVLR